MSVFDRIVCGVDGSPEALGALRQARRLLTPGGRIVAITVSELGAAVRAGWSAVEIAAQLKREAEEVRAEASRKLARLADAEARVVDGSPAERILEAVGEEEATLVALGGHWHSRAAGILLGSVATQLLHDAPCAVLVARPPVDASCFPHSIVAGVDGSSDSLAAAVAAEEVAERFGASLRLIAATGGKPVDVDGLVRLRAWTPAYAGIPAGGRVATQRIPALEWSERKPLDALLGASAGSDLVVVGSRGLHGIAALGSVSERIAHRARCSVLVVRPGD